MNDQVSFQAAEIERLKHRVKALEALLAESCTG